MPSAEPCLCTTTRAQSITKQRQNNSFYVQFMCLSGNQSLNSEGGAEKNRYLHRARAEATVLQAGHQQMLKLLETKQGRQFCYLSPRSNNASLPAVWSPAQGGLKPPRAVPPSRSDTALRGPRALEWLLGTCDTRCGSCWLH